MSIQFKPSHGSEESYDNTARGLRSAIKQGCVNMPKEYAQILAKMDKKWAEEGEL
jgi:hypothetical protein